jgi:hypothetical protein
MKKKLFLALPLLALLCLAMVGQTLGQNRMPGVHENDQFIYTITAFWNSNNQGATVPADLLSVNETRWYNVTISSISNSNVSSNDIWHFANGTESTVVVVQNVASGTSYVMKGLVEITSANLGPNDLLYDSADDPRRINQTVSVDYGNNKRDTNAISFSYPLTDTSTGATGYGTEAFYFDKATGILVAKTDSSVSSGENVTIVMLLVGTNLWPITTVPSLASASSSSASGSPQVFGVPLPILVLVAVVAVLIVAIAAVVVLHGRKRHRRKTRR